MPLGAQSAHHVTLHLTPPISATALKVQASTSPWDITNGQNQRPKTPGEAHEVHHWSGDDAFQIQKANVTSVQSLSSQSSVSPVSAGVARQGS